MAINILQIALNLFRNNSAIKVLAKKRSTSAIKKLSDANKARKLTKKQTKQAEDLEDIADAKYGKSREKGLNIRQLIKSCNKTRRNNAIRDKVTIVSIKRGKNNSILSKSLTYDKTGSKLVIRPHKHIVKVKLTKGEPANVPIHQAKRLVIGCDCEDWAYLWNYSMATRFGAAEITTPEGTQYPVMTNPGLAPGLCKHQFVLLNLLLQRKL